MLTLDQKQFALDWLFRLHIYPGVAIEVPKGLIECNLVTSGANRTVYSTEINMDHPMAEWLTQCEGPWAMKMKKPMSERNTYIAFGRTVDAAMFRIMTAG